MGRPPRRQAGFTLLELLIVMAILGIIAALAYPGYAHMVRRARYAEAKQQMGVLARSLTLYRVEHGHYPPDESRNVAPPGISNWPTDVPYDSAYDYDHWRVGEGTCYVQIGYAGESGTRAYPVHEIHARPSEFEMIDDNLVLGIDTYECGLSGKGPVN